MKQLISFIEFDREQSWKYIARKRKSKKIKQIKLPETQTWMFSTDLDEEIDNLLTKLESIPCH